MRHTITRALIVYAIFASIPFTSLAQPGPRHRAGGAGSRTAKSWLPLGSGMTVSRSEGNYSFFVKFSLI